jgi:hypothetical protein
LKSQWPDLIENGSDPFRGLARLAGKGADPLGERHASYNCDRDIGVSHARNEFHWARQKQ